MARDVAPIGEDVVIDTNTPDVETTVEALIRLHNRMPLNSSLSDGDTLTWDATNGVWVPGSASSGVTRPMQTGYVYLPETGNSSVQGTALGGTNGYSYTIPVWLPDITIATIGVYAAAAATATTYDARLGIYRSNAGGIPDALLVDAGTVSLLTTGAKSATVNVAADAGLYWLTLAIQNVTGYSGGPQLSGLQQTNYPEIPVANYGSLRFNRGFVYSADLTGALPDPYPFVIDSFGQNTPLIGVGV